MSTTFDEGHGQRSCLLREARDCGLRGRASFLCLTDTWKMVGARPVLPLSDPQGRLTHGNRIRSGAVSPLTALI